MRVLHQKIHHHLKLQHHRHTGRLLQHRHTSYRGLAVVFVMAGLAMAGITIAGRVAADSLTVQGMVLAPIPTSAALIAQPADGATVTGGSTLVAGSCPIISPQVIVQIIVNASVAGSAACDANNDFSLPITLSAGAQVLVARTYTITNQAGPVSSPVHITVPTGTTAKSPSPVLLTATEPFSSLDSNASATWSGAISGGTPPYHIHIDWNDGTQDNVTNTGGEQSFDHTYRKFVSYNPLITVADSAGHATSEQFAVGTYTLAAAKISPSTYDTPAVTPATLLGLYGMLITAVSISGIIWLEAKHAARHEMTIGHTPA